MKQIRRRRKLWLRSGLGLQIDGNAMLTCKKMIQKFLSQTSSTFPQSFLCPMAVCLETCCSMAGSEQIWVLWTSVAEITQLLEGGSSLPVPCHPSSHVQSHVPHTWYGFVWLCIVRLSTLPISTIFHSPAAVLCVFGFTTQQKRAHYHLCSWGGGLCDQTQTTEFGSKVILFPLRDYCWILFLLTWTRPAQELLITSSPETQLKVKLSCLKVIIRNSSSQDSCYRQSMAPDRQWIWLFVTV